MGGRVGVVARRAAALWVPVAVAVTGLAVLVAAAVQQDIRSGANEPQLQLAQDAAARLDGGAAPGDVVPPQPVDVARSLSPFLLVFDGAGRLVASSATLHGQPPPYPPGVFGSARPDGYRVTWQPEAGVRSATVVVAWRGGFVVAGRSLRSAEERVHTVQVVVGALWLGTLLAAAGAALLAAAWWPDA